MTRTKIPKSDPMKFIAGTATLSEQENAAQRPDEHK